FVLTYVLTAIGFLRERKSGTLDRVKVSPIRRSELVIGYVLGFGVLATIQSIILLGSGVYFLGAEFEHGIGLFFLVEILGALTGLGFGIVLSLFAENEFQVQQFMPFVIGPQIILGNTFRPVDELAWYLEYPARLMPVTYLIRAMDYVVLGTGNAGDLWISIGFLSITAMISIVLSTIIVRRTS
ncbi:MAG: ABC transporter permease, partial [Halobacteriaceae archaeon]